MGFSDCRAGLLGAVLVAGAVAGMSPSVVRAAGEGYYVGGGLGTAYRNESGRSGIATDGRAYDYDLKFRLRPSARAFAGREFSSGFRLELEALAFRYKSRNATTAGSTLGASGTSLGLMGNVLYDLLPSHLPTSVYIGAGAGGMRDRKKARVDGASATASSTALALQGIFGIEQRVSETISLGVRYAFMTTKKQGYTFFPGTSDKLGNNTHHVIATLSYHFPAGERRMMEGTGTGPAESVAAATMSPGPVPVQAAAGSGPALKPVARDIPRSYIVYFPFASHVLAADGKATVDEAIGAFRTYGYASVRLQGSADTVGSGGYNDTLSRRRAEAVRNYMTSRGVDSGAISVDWSGERNLRVPTGQNVRERDNRNVAIFLTR